MVVNMACPKCGGTASEYDVNKWGCLKCGNKFLYAPPQPPQTFIQANISVQGSSLFDIVPGSACPPAPAFQKRSETVPGYFGEQKANEKTIRSHQLLLIGNRIKFYTLGLINAVLLFLMLVLAVGILIGFFSDSQTKWENVLGATAGGLILFGLPFIFIFPKWWKSVKRKRSLKAEIVRLRSRNDQLIAEKDDDVVIGHHIFCPNCREAFGYIEANEKMPNGLKHCLTCGKQFYTTQGYSYSLANTAEA